jgi:MYXO-CTERM domain-containing protein
VYLVGVTEEPAVLGALAAAAAAALQRVE